MRGPETKESAQTAQPGTPEPQSHLPQSTSEQCSVPIVDESGAHAKGKKAENLVTLSSQCASPIATCPEKGHETTYPEGGLRAWLVVFGSWCALAVVFGTMNIIGPLLSYLIHHQLISYSAGSVGWIFSTYVFLTFVGAIFIGPVFDQYGPKWFILAGSIGLCSTMFLLGVCERFWQFMVVFGFLGGASGWLLFTPSIAAIGHHFRKKRGNATGIAASGGAFAGVVFNLMLAYLLPSLGFAWSTRILGFIYVCLCTIACLCIRSRLPPTKSTYANAKPDLLIFKDLAFTVTVLGIYLLQWAFFIPTAYANSYALYRGFSSYFSYLVLVLLNVGSIFGRWLPGFYADRIGRFNITILTTILTMVSVLGIWLPAGGTTAGLVVFALTFGFSSGSSLSVTPVCIGQLCATENYGRYFATCYTVVSIGSLTGIPLAGNILSSNNGDYWGVIVFTGACYVGAFAAFVMVRILKTGWKLMVVY